MDDGHDRLPQKMGQTDGAQRFRPYQKPGSAGQTIADIERQEKIERLRVEAADKETFGDDEEYNDYGSKPAKPKKKHRFLRLLGWLLLIAVLTGGGAAAGWYFYLRKQPKPAQSSEQAAAPKPTAEASQPTDTHTSSAFQLQFDYPQTWKVTDNPDNTIVAVSPAMQLQLASVTPTSVSQVQTGQVVMTIRHKQPSLPEFKNGSASAAIESEKINYAKPSQTQRGSTYISFLNYIDSTAKGIDGVYVTGDSGYQKDQVIPLADIIKSEPIITLTFHKCADTKCGSPGATVTLAAGEWQNPAFAKPLKTILQSIVAD